MEVRFGTPCLEDERLWRLAVSGEATAFEELVRRHSPRVASVASRFLRNPQDVEDVVQDTFLRAFQHLHHCRNGAAIRPWLIRIAVNLCKNRLRSAWWKQVLLLGADAEAQLDEKDLCTSPMDDPQALVERTLERAELERAVAQLPYRLRVPFVLRFFEDLSGAEIAAIQDCSENSVWTRIYAARKQVRARLSERGAIFHDQD